MDFVFHTSFYKFASGILKYAKEIQTAQFCADQAIGSGL